VEYREKKRKCLGETLDSYLDEGRDKRSCSLSSNILPDFHRHNDAQDIYPAATCPVTALNLIVSGVHVDRRYLGPKPEGVQSGPAKHVTILRTFVPICSVTRVESWAQSYPHQHMMDTRGEYSVANTTSKTQDR
jgi:hypothetical protein